MDRSIPAKHRPLFASICFLISLLALIWEPAPVAANATSTDILEQFWTSGYGAVTSDTTQRTALKNTLLAKAKPDACFYGIGDPDNFYNPDLVLPCGTDSEPKVNQAYVWGMAQSAGNLWFGTAANVLCLVEGGFLQVTTPQENTCWVCEFGETQFFNPDPPPDPRIGDWRPSRIFVYDTENNVQIEKTNDIPYPHNLRLNTTLGIRSAGSLDNVVILGGPSLTGGVNLFAFNTLSGEFITSTNLPDYNNIRKWLTVDGVLYTALGNTGGGGSVLRWNGNTEAPFQFDLVGELDTDGAELAFHENRLFVSTWPSTTLSEQPMPMAGIWMSPLIPSGGLTPAQKSDWVKVWKPTDYEPDPVTAATYGGGAMASFDGYLYWGTMHVPLMATLAHMKIYGQPPDPESAVMTVLGTHRAISIFRGKNFGTAAEIELVYGDPFLPNYDPPGADPETEPGQWEIVPNNMNAYPLYGLSGFGNFFNNYTWTMGVYKDQLFVGTMDWSFLFGTLVGPFLESYLAPIPEGILKLAQYFYGADLFRFASSDCHAVPESLSGVGNYTNYGIRTMLPSENALYLGTANPMNLLTNPDDNLPEGGWELRELTGDPGPAPPPAAMETHPAMVYNPLKDQFFVVYTTLRDHGIRLYGRLVKPDGTPIGDEFLIDETADIHAFPTAAFDENNQRYLVVWTQVHSPGESFQTGIYGRLLEWDGQPHGNTFRISADADLPEVKGQGYPSVAFGKVDDDGNESDGFLVTWTGFRMLMQETSVPSMGIFGQMIKADGSPVKENFPITGLNTEAPAAAFFPATAYDTLQNRYFVAWTTTTQIPEQLLNNKEILNVLAYENTGMNTDIQGRFVGVNGQCSHIIPISSDDPDYVADEQSFPSVAYGNVDDGNGQTAGFLVAWADARIKNETTPMDMDIFGQLLKGDGSLVKGNFMISQDGAYPPVAPLFPKAAFGRIRTGGEGFLIVWPDISNALSPKTEQVNLLDIHGRFVKSDGTCSGDNFLISDTALFQCTPALAYNTASRDFLAAFSKTDAVTYNINIAFSLVGTSKTFYVDILNGDDTHDGSVDDPWKTLHHAIIQINAKGTGTYTLHMAPGTYSVAGGEADAQIIISQSNITLVGADGNESVLNGMDATHWTRGLEISGDNVTIRNLHITGFFDLGDEGIRISAGTKSEISQCHIHDNHQGIKVTHATGSKIEGCEIYRNSTHGIDMSWSSNGAIVENRIYAHPEYGIRVECSPQISRNRIYDNQYGILVEALDQETASPVIKNNVIYESTSGAMACGIFMRSNDTAEVNPEIYHNTIDRGAGTGISIEKNGTGGAAPLIRYNIISNFKQYGIQNCNGNPVMDYNDVWHNTGGNYSPDCPAGDHDISLDPLYGSYELQSTSPCIDAIPLASGDPVRIDYAGYARPRNQCFDMGAFEYVGAAAYPYDPPGGVGLVTDYRIFTVPLNMGTGADLRSTMEGALGTYDAAYWRVFAFVGGRYLEMNTPAFSGLKVAPGMAFWIITLDTSPIRFEAGICPDGIPYTLELPPGWSLVALPWIDTPINLGNISVTDGTNTYAITGTGNNLTQRCLWDYTGNGPYSGYEKRNLSAFALQCGTGYFIKVLADSSVKLIIPPENLAAQPMVETAPAYDKTPSADSEEQPPSPPGGYAPEAAQPNIQVNGKDEMVTVSSGTPVSIRIGLDPGAQAGQKADWWIAAHTPFDPPFDWYSYVYPEGWRPGVHVAAQTPLFGLAPPFEVLNMVLPTGQYRFYFAVDDNADGEADVTWVDSVEVEVQ